MNLKKFWQKLKDLYGWDRSQLFYWQDKRAYYKALASGWKRKMGEAKNQTQFNQAKFRYEDYESLYIKADFNVKQYDRDEVEPGWRN